MYNLFSICSGVFTTQNDWATLKCIFISIIPDSSSETVGHIDIYIFTRNFRYHWCFRWLKSKIY